MKYYINGKEVKTKATHKNNPIYKKVLESPGKCVWDGKYIRILWNTIYTPSKLVDLDGNQIVVIVKNDKYDEVL